MQPIVSQENGQFKAMLALSTETEVPLVYDNTVTRSEITSGWTSVGDIGIVRLDGRIAYALTDDFEIYYDAGSRTIASYAGLRIGFHDESNTHHFAFDIITSPQFTVSKNFKNTITNINADSESVTSVLGGGFSIGWNNDSKRLLYTSIALLNYKTDIEIRQSGSRVDNIAFNDTGKQLIFAPGIRFQDNNVGFSFELGYNQIEWSRHDTIKREGSFAFIMDSQFK